MSTELINALLPKYNISKSLAKFVSEEADVFKRPMAKVLREFAGLKQREINQIMINDKRDIDLPLLTKGIKKTILKNPQINDLPSNITLKEVFRQTGFSPEKILSLISEFKPTITIQGKNYFLNATIPDVNKNVSEKDIKKYGLKPKRILDRARYESRSPGGGPVQRSRFQKYKIANIVKREVASQARINFIPEKQIKVDKELGHPVFTNSLFCSVLRRKKLHHLLKSLIN